MELQLFCEGHSPLPWAPKRVGMSSGFAAAMVCPLTLLGSRKQSGLVPVSSEEKRGVCQSRQLKDGFSLTPIVKAAY